MPRSTGASPGSRSTALIRGCNPAPGAWTTLDGKQLKIFDAKPLPAKDPKGIAGKMGEIVAIESRRFHRRLRRRPLQGHPRSTRRSQEDRRLRIYRHRQARRRGEVRLIFISSNGPPPMPASQHQIAEIRHRNRPGRQAAPDHGIRQGEARHRGRESRTLRPLQGQGVDGLHQVAAETSRTAS